MKASEARPLRPVDVAPEEMMPEVSKSFKGVHPRLLVNEREDEVRRLVQLDYDIWVLEEFFRNRGEL